MLIELREKLNKINQLAGRGIDDDSISELLKAGESVKKYKYSQLRWYITYHNVVSVGNVFIDFQTFITTDPERSFIEKDWTEMILGSAIEVFPKEITIIDYVEEKTDMSKK